MTDTNDRVEAKAAEMYEQYRIDHPGARMYPWSQQPFRPTLDHWRAKALHTLNGDASE